MSYDTAPTDPHHGGKMTFDLWLAWLEQIMRDWQTSWGNLPYTLPLADCTGLECWRDAYDDGMTPLDAFHADQENWED